MQRIIFRAIAAGQAAVLARRMAQSRLTRLALTVAVANDRFISAGTKPLAER
jgi:hypothetical protein